MWWIQSELFPWAAPEQDGAGLDCRTGTLTVVRWPWGGEVGSRAGCLPG